MVLLKKKFRQKVLVPKVYLTRNTLSKLKDKNTSIEAGQELAITAKDIQNTGNLSANNITITTDNLTNKIYTWCK